MTTIRLTNTLTRKKDEFRPLDPGNVRMYVCGPTVYDRAHLGNARAAVVFDVLFRLLRQVYGAGHVTYVRNITDVDDKINAAALARKEAGAEGTLEQLIRERSDETTRWYREDMAALGTLPPTQEPRATEWIGAMIEMIKGLVAKGHAYEAEGHVLFSVASYPEYGRLSGRSVEDMIAGARVEVAPYKRDPMDFVLWKPSDADLPGWDSPWGRGRPGWHIECSAMAGELLGESFDIHGGGIDLQFPHHENEIAQSRCVGHPFARVWMHNEMLQVEGRKMSKSLGNFFTVRDLLDQGVPGEVIRFVLLGAHYSKPMDWTEKKRDEAYRRLEKWGMAYQIVRRHGYDVRLNPEQEFDSLLKVLGDDLNTSLALGMVDIQVNYVIDNNQPDNEGAAARFADAAGKFVTGLQLLGFENLRNWQSEVEIIAAAYGDRIEELLAQRRSAKSARDFASADALRDRLLASGIELRDLPNGDVQWTIRTGFNPAKLEDLT